MRDSLHADNRIQRCAKAISRNRHSDAEVSWIAWSLSRVSGRPDSKPDDLVFLGDQTQNRMIIAKPKYQWRSSNKMLDDPHTLKPSEITENEDAHRVIRWLTS